MRSHCLSWGGILNLVIPCVDKDVGNVNITRNYKANTLTISQPLLSQQIIGICSEPAMPSVVLFVDYNTHTGSQ